MLTGCASASVLGTASRLRSKHRQTRADWEPRCAAKFVQGLRERGYKVELFALATPREESLLGIYQPHELQHAAGGANPRFVSEKYHDEAMQGFESTLARTAAQLDRVRVADR